MASFFFSFSFRFSDFSSFLFEEYFLSFLWLLDLERRLDLDLDRFRSRDDLRFLSLDRDFFLDRDRFLSLERLASRLLYLFLDRDRRLDRDLVRLLRDRE